MGAAGWADSAGMADESPKPGEDWTVELALQNT